MLVSVRAGLCFLFLATGCMSPPDAGGDDPPIGSSLKELAVCSSDGSVKDQPPCESEAEPLTAVAEPPSGWVCLWSHPDARDGPPRIAVYWSPTQAAHAVAYFSKATVPLSGVLSLETNGKRGFYNWTGGGANGFVRLPETLGTQASFRILVYSSFYETNETDLQGGRIEQLWFRHGDDFSVRQRLNLAGESYTFEFLEGRGRQLGHSFSLEDGNRAITFQILQLLYGDSNEFMTTVPQGDC